MSFAAKVKNELARQEIQKKCCQKAELTALIHMNGSLQITAGQFVLNISTENPAVARNIFLLLKKLYSINSDIMARKKSRLKKNHTYLVRVDDSKKAKEILTDLNVLTSKYHFKKKISREITVRKCCRRSYLRGVYLAKGSLNNPDSSHHLEIRVEYEEQGQEVLDLLKTFNLESRLIARKNYYLVYLKDGQKIVEFLNIIGAHQALFDYENARIIKDMRNKTNRMVNCETANLNKTVHAAINQLESIKIVDQARGLQNLPRSLKQVAELRMKHPEATLKELGDMFDPPLSKSGVNHRLRKIEKLAQQILSK